MDPLDHISWLEENCAWYRDLEVGKLNIDVRRCPGWNLERLINHVSFGVATVAPAAIATPADQQFKGKGFPTEPPRGKEAIETFAANSAACVEAFKQADPDKPCWTFPGPGTARYWFRRAAIETTLHRMDAADALGLGVAHLSDERACDAIAEAVQYALPLAASWAGSPQGKLTVEATCLQAPMSVGAGDQQALLKGEPHDVLDALWGRLNDRVEVAGDSSVAESWLGLIEIAFANR